MLANRNFININLKMLNKPSIVEHNHHRFMIFSAPDDKSLDYWLEVSAAITLGV